MQSPFPDDLAIQGSTGSLLPGEENRVLEIYADGKGRFARYLPDELGPPLEEVVFKVSDEQLEALWTAIQKYEFFSLEPRYENSDIDDGAFAMMTITAQGRTHQVEAENTFVPGFQYLLESINQTTPSGKDLLYAVLAADQ